MTIDYNRFSTENTSGTPLLPSTTVRIHFHQHMVDIRLRYHTVAVAAVVVDKPRMPVLHRRKGSHRRASLPPCHHPRKVSLRPNSQVFYLPHYKESVIKLADRLVIKRELLLSGRHDTHCAAHTVRCRSTDERSCSAQCWSPSSHGIRIRRHTIWHRRCPALQRR